MRGAFQAVVRVAREIEPHRVDGLLDPTPAGFRKRQKIGVERRVIDLKSATQVDQGWRVRGWLPCAISCSERAIFAANSGVNSS